MATNPNQDIKSTVKETAEIIENTLKSIAENIKEIFEAALSSTDNVVQSYGKDIQKNLNSMVKSTDKMLENEIKLKMGILSRKDIEKQLVESIKKREILEVKINNLAKENPALARQLQQEYDVAVASSKEFEEALRKQGDHLKEIDNRVGTLGSAFKGLAKIPLVGQLINAEEALTAMKSKANETGNRLQIIGAGLKEASKNASSFLLAAAGKTVIDRFKAIDTANENLARSLGVSYKEADKLTSRYVRLAEASGDIFLTSTKLAKTTQDLSDELGIGVQLDDKRLQFATKIREQGKFSVEFTNQLTRLTAVRKEDEEEVLKKANAQITAVKLQTGVNLNNRQILESTTKASSAIQLNFKGSFTELAKATAQTKALGLEMNRVEDIAGGLLDFESSIQAQMEAELLTGKALNVDKARYQALTNDTVGLAKTLAQDIGTAEEYSKMNRIQQEGLAKAYGMSREEVSKMLLEQKFAKDLGGKSLEEKQKEYNLAVKQGKEKEYLAKIGNQELKDQLEQNGLQTKQAAIQEKLASSMDSFAKALMPIAEVFQKILGFLTQFPGLIKAATIALVAMKAASMFGKGSALSGGGLPSLTGGPSSGGGGMTSAVTGTADKAATLKQIQQMKAQNPGMTSAEALKSIKSGTSTVTEATVEAGAKGGGGFFGKVGGFFSNIAKKLDPKAAVKTWLKTNVGKFLGKLFKLPVISTVLEGIFANSDIKSMIADPGVSNDSLSQAVGKRVVQALGSVLGQIGGGALGSLIPIPGVGTILGAMAGGAAGNWLGGLIADTVGAKPIGDLTLGMYSKELEAAGRKPPAGGTAPELATGGIVTQTGLAKVDSGEVYLGANSITVLRDMLNALKDQNKYLMALVNKDTTISIDGQKVANVVAQNVPTTYGNLLNPGSSTYRK